MLALFSREITSTACSYRLPSSPSPSSPEAAAALALAREAYGYRAVKNILEKDEDKVVAMPVRAPATIIHENLRGQAAYS